MSKSKPDMTDPIVPLDEVGVIALVGEVERGPECSVYANHPTYNPWGYPAQPNTEATPRINYDKGLDDEETPKAAPVMSPAPRDPREMLLTRTEQLIMIHGHKAPQCYLCATPKQVELRRDRKTGIIVCTPCALLHFQTQ